MELNKVIGIIIIIIGVIWVANLFIAEPLLNQKQMYDYHGGEIFPEVQLYYHPKCPLGNCTEIKPIGIVENIIPTWQMPGGRIDISQFFYCEEHNLIFVMR